MKSRRSTWTPEMVASIQKRIDGGENIRSFEKELGIKAQSFYSARNRLNKKKKKTYAYTDVTLAPLKEEEALPGGKMMIVIGNTADIKNLVSSWR